MKRSLGLIETVGLTAAIEAADAAVKSANVALIGYELAKGDGMATVKIEGDVGAVQAAVGAAYAAASKVGRVFSVRVIPRPAEGLEKMVYSAETVGLERRETAIVPVPETKKPQGGEAPAGGDEEPEEEPGLEGGAEPEMPVEDAAETAGTKNGKKKRKR